MGQTSFARRGMPTIGRGSPPAVKRFLGARARSYSPRRDTKRAFGSIS
jgi:hypothetical protein